MKRMFAVLSVVSLALVIAVPALAQAPSTNAKPEQLSKQQVNTLISTAKTRPSISASQTSTRSSAKTIVPRRKNTRP